MNERWVCKRCFADNDSTSGECVRCGLIRGAEATPTDQAAWAAAAEPARQQRGRSWAWLLRFWWIPAVVIALAVGYFVNARRDGSGQIESAGTVSIDDLRVGDCFNLGEEEVEIAEVDGVPCTEPHRYQIFHITLHETATYPSDDALTVIFGQLCVEPFEQFVGIPVEESELWATMVTPTEDSFRDGGRSYICVIFDNTSSTLTSSLQGAKR